MNLYSATAHSASASRHRHRGRTFPFVLNTVANAFTNFNYNARKARTFQFVDNLTFDLSPHTLKMGINFRFGRQFDDRSSAGGQIEPLVGFGAGSSSFTGFSIPTDAVAGTATAPTGSPGINATDRAVLQSTVNNFLGRIGSFSQGFVVDPSNPGTFAPAGTRWNWRAYYPEYDFYVQDTWRFRPNLVLDLGLRYEIKLSPRSKDLPILVANQPFTIGAAASNTLRWEEGKLFKNDLNNFSPSIGLAWDPFKSGKTSVRANYRLSYDRFGSQVFANSIYQSAPGNTSFRLGIGNRHLESPVAKRFAESGSDPDARPASPARSYLPQPASRWSIRTRDIRRYTSGLQVFREKCGRTT